MKKNYWTPGAIKGIFENLSYLPPVMLILAAVLCVLAIKESRDFVVEAKQSIADSNVKQNPIQLEKRPLDTNSLEAIKKALVVNNPDIQIQVGQGGVLTISTPTMELYKDWMATALSVQSYGKGGAVWEATEICMNSCGTNAKLSISVKGFVQSISGAEDSKAGDTKPKVDAAPEKK